MFYQCIQLQTLTGTGIENAYFLDMYRMFSGCFNLKSLKIQGKPVAANSAFASNYKLTDVD